MTKCLGKARWSGPDGPSGGQTSSGSQVDLDSSVRNREFILGKKHNRCIKYMARIQSLYIIFDRELFHYYNESGYKSRHKLWDYAEMIMRNSRGRFLDTSKVSSLNSGLTGVH